MKKLLNSENGSSAVETLLIVVIVGLVGFVGWYVYHSNKNANATLNAAAKDSRGSVKFTKQPSKANYFTIKEWGVRAPYNGSLTLEYQRNSSNSSVMMLSSSQLNAGGPSVCTTADGAAGYVQRYLPTDEVAPGETAQQFLSQNFVASNSKAPAYAKVGDYYYIYSTGQTDNCKNTALYEQTQSAFEAIIPKLQAN